MMSPEQYDQALCAQVGGELFFAPERGESPAYLIRQAKAVCAKCPIKEPCLEDALAHPGAAGILGGTTESERRTILKRRRFAA